MMVETKTASALTMLQVFPINGLTFLQINEYVPWFVNKVR